MPADRVAAPSRQPSLAFIGPTLGRHDGWVTTQGEVLAGLFGDEMPVHSSSDRLSPVGRAVDHAVDLLRWRNTIDVAVVSVFSGRGFALADEAILVTRALGIPTVAWLHGGNLPDFGNAHPRWTRRVLRSVDAVVSPTPYLDRWARTLVPATTVVPNVLVLDDYGDRVRTQARPRLLWMRTFQELYDPGTAVRVLAALRETGVDATLTMAGQDKGLLPDTRDLAARLGVADWIDFPGFVAGRDKADLLDAHDIFLNTNRVDNAPVTVLEAAASGLAIVSTDVGGIPDLIEDGRSGVLVPSGDAYPMVDAVRRLLDDPALFRQVTTGARAVVEASAWPSVRDRWLEVLVALPVSRHRRRAHGSPPP
jgi:glycosyltransferase involved in cell wall biosynthesis